MTGAKFLISACLFLLACVVCCSQVANAQTQGGEGPCSFDGSDDLKRGKPQIFGKDFLVPPLHLRFVRKETGKPVIPKIVHVSYGWKWIEYPYPEHSWGAWSDAGEAFQCSTGGSNELVVPARTVKPRGWYDGKYTRFPHNLSGSKRPKFDGVVIVVEFDNCRPRLVISAGELDDYKGTAATLKLPCTWPVEVQFEQSPK